MKIWLKKKERNASNKYFNTHISIKIFWLVNIDMRPTKFIWDPYDLVGPMWILTNKKECVEKCVLLAFLKKNILIICKFFMWHSY